MIGDRPLPVLSLFRFRCPLMEAFCQTCQASICVHLYENVDMRAKMGAVGRKLIESKYCTNVTGGKIVHLLKGLTKD